MSTKRVRKARMTASTGDDAQRKRPIGSMPQERWTRPNSQLRPRDSQLAAMAARAELDLDSATIMFPDTQLGDRLTDSIPHISFRHKEDTNADPTVRIIAGSGAA